VPHGKLGQIGLTRRKRSGGARLGGGADQAQGQGQQEKPRRRG